MVKREFYLQHDELLDGKSRRPNISIHRAITWQRRTPTAAAERTKTAASVRTASVKSRQLSASSSASSRASGGTRVLCESGRKDNDYGEACIYRDRDGTVLLHRCPWRFTSEGHVAIMQHIGGCSTFPRTPGLSGGRSHFSGFQVKRSEEHTSELQSQN